MGTIGERIKLAIALGCKGNASALARACGVKPQAVTQWVSDQTKPNCINIFHIETRTGISARWIALADGPMRVDNQGTSVTHAEASDLYDRIDKATPAVKQAIEGLISAALKED